MRFDQLKNMLTRRLTQKPELEKNSLKVGAMFLTYKKQCIPKIMAKKDLKVGMQNPDFGFWVSLLVQVSSDQPNFFFVGFHPTCIFTQVGGSDYVPSPTYTFWSAT